MAKTSSIPKLLHNAEYKREHIRRNHQAIHRCRVGRHAALAITPIVAAIGFIHDPITAVIAGALGIMLTLAVRAWLREVSGRRAQWIRGDRVSLHNTMVNLREKRAKAAAVEAEQAARRERARAQQEQMRAAAERKRAELEYQRERQCRDKIRHPSEESAVDHMLNLRPRSGKRLNVYFCKFCEHWHVGNSSMAASGLKYHPFKKLAQ